MVDYETDTRPFAECLKEFALTANGGNLYGARQKAAAELKVKDDTLAGWIKGRVCMQEASYRRLMTLVTAQSKRGEE